MFIIIIIIDCNIDKINHIDELCKNFVLEFICTESQTFYTFISYCPNSVPVANLCKIQLCSVPLQFYPQTVFGRNMLNVRVYIQIFSNVFSTRITIDQNDFATL